MLTYYSESERRCSNLSYLESPPIWVGNFPCQQAQLALFLIMAAIIFFINIFFVLFDAGLQPMIRFPRFIKIYRLVQFFYIFENQATHPNVLRVCNLTHILLLLCHWFAAFYYIISKVSLQHAYFKQYPMTARVVLMMLSCCGLKV